MTDSTSIEGSRPSPWRQPGNVPDTEQFPEFCLHRNGGDGGCDGGCPPITSTCTSITSTSSASTPTRTELSSSPVSYSRSSTLSTVSTSPSVISILSAPEFESKRLRVRHHHQPQQLQLQQHPWTSSTSPTPRSRQDRKALQAARQHRSACRRNVTPLGIKDAKSSLSLAKARRFQRSASSAADALAAVEPPHDQGLTRMAFAEQQRWITVQEKTFTKWYAVCAFPT